MIRLVTRGDDAGSSKSANRAIHAAAKKGILRNASVLAPGPSVNHAAKVLGGLVKSGEICVGLHATATCEWEWPVWGPVLGADDVPSLVDERGLFHRTLEKLSEGDAPAGKVRADILAEVAAQLDRLRSLGLPVKYIDEHMGLGRIEGVGDGLARIAKREGLVFRPGLDHLPQPPAEGGEFEEDDNASRLIAALGCAAPGTYLVAGHPAFDDDEMARCHGAGKAEGEVGPARDAERLMFMREDVVAWCRDNDIRLLRYDEL